MLFRRRKPPGRIEAFRTWLWPRHSWGRSARYFSKRVLRLSATPHAIAAGVAAGTFASFTPFVGFHLLMAAVLAAIVRGNVVAAALGTIVGNPLTFPFIWLATFEIGKFLLGEGGEERMKLVEITRSLFEKSFVDIVPLLKTMVVGGLPLGIAAALVAYFGTRWAVIVYQNARRRRLEELRLEDDPAAADERPGGTS